jgi:hypothetical protein
MLTQYNRAMKTGHASRSKNAENLLFSCMVNNVCPIFQSASYCLIETLDVPQVFLPFL